MRVVARLDLFRLVWLVLTAVTAAAYAPPSAAQHASLAPDTATIAEQYLLAAANQERERRGLPALKRDPHLASAAAQHAREMATHGTISHQFAGEPELTNRGASAGVAFSLISENVAEAPDVIMIHDMWMRSDHHRANLLDPSVDAAGIAVISRGGELFAVEDFAKTVRAATFAQQEAAIAALVARRGMAVSENPELVEAARKTCSMDSGYAGARRPWFIMRFTSDSLNRLPEQLETKLGSPRYREAAVGACSTQGHGAFSSYSFAVLLYP
jgi:uncharacterized protein YkwD